MRREDDQPEERPNDRSSKDWTVRREGPGGAVIVLVAVLVLLLVFVLQNTESVRVDFLFWSGRWPLWVVIAIAAVLGLAAGWIVSVVRRRRQRRDGDASGRA